MLVHPLTRTLTSSTSMRMLTLLNLMFENPSVMHIGWRPVVASMVRLLKVMSDEVPPTPL